MDKKLIVKVQIELTGVAYEEYMTWFNSGGLVQCVHSGLDQSPTEETPEQEMVGAIKADTEAFFEHVLNMKGEEVRDCIYVCEIIED